MLRATAGHLAIYSFIRQSFASWVSEVKIFLKEPQETLGLIPKAERQMTDTLQSVSAPGSSDDHEKHEAITMGVMLDPAQTAC